MPAFTICQLNIYNPSLTPSIISLLNRVTNVSSNPVLKFSYDSKLLVSASYDGTVNVWDVKLSPLELRSCRICHPALAVCLLKSVLLEAEKAKEM